MRILKTPRGYEVLNDEDRLLSTFSTREEAKMRALKIQQIVNTNIQMMIDKPQLKTRTK